MKAYNWTRRSLRSKVQRAQNRKAGFQGFANMTEKGLWVKLSSQKMLKF